MLWPHRMHNPLVSQGRPRLGPSVKLRADVVPGGTFVGLWN